MHTFTLNIFNRKKMNDLLKIYRDSNQLDFEKIWKEGTFVFDANVLLDLYRLPESAKNDLLGVLQNDNFKDRIWIGFQVFLEYLSNRLSVIGDQKNMFAKVKTATLSTIEKINTINAEYKSEIDNHKLSQRHALINPEHFLNDSSFKKSTKIFRKFVKHLEKLEKQQADVNDSDKLRDLITTIFENKIGSTLTKEELEDIYKEGVKRYANKIPPGYMDNKKDGSYYFKENEYIRKYGDLTFWKEIIKHAKKQKLKYLVLVTGDVKEDWWEEKRGRKISARKELLNEIYTECPDLEVFYLYNTSSFLQFAKKEIDNNIKDSSIDETFKLISNYYNERAIKIGDISPNKKEYLKQLYSLNQSISTNHLKLQDVNSQLSKLNLYRDNLYEKSNPLDDIRELAHNLAYTEEEYTEEINEIQNRLNLDMEIQKRLIEKLKLEE
ncbi:hypothetical protein SAMN06265349_10389 [Flavobacterium resistens]|uniref:PIN like domain-containing protein n=2 Tax=Flavobacterium resistens TaxID=443612 RepID=A0A521DBC5_9FLAO|nr:hypothetical protein SAMN06265349_10389 [Flavobacterium resistens]